MSTTVQFFNNVKDLCEAVVKHGLKVRGIKELEREEDDLDSWDTSLYNPITATDCTGFKGIPI